VFAQSLLANCSQTGRIVTNVTGKSPGQASTFVDLWKFTLVNYNAGPGCLWSALADSYKAGERLTWTNVSARLDPVCQAGVKYVDSISAGQPATPTPTAWVFGGTSLPQPNFPTAPLTTGTRVTPGTPAPAGAGSPTATLRASLTPTRALSPTRTPTRTATSGSYPAAPTATQFGYPIGTPTLTITP
jgi:hypothetical protein